MKPYNGHANPQFLKTPVPCDQLIAVFFALIGCAFAFLHFLKLIKFVNKILYFYILFYLYLYN